MKALKTVAQWVEDNEFRLPFYTRTLKGNIHTGFSIPLWKWVSQCFFKKEWHESLMESEASIVYFLSDNTTFEIFHDGTFHRCYFIFIKVA